MLLLHKKEIAAGNAIRREKRFQYGGVGFFPRSEQTVCVDSFSFTVICVFYFMER